jgi:hypothetical protein
MSTKALSASQSHLQYYVTTVTLESRKYDSGINQLFPVSIQLGFILQSFLLHSYFTFFLPAFLQGYFDKEATENYYNALEDLQPSSKRLTSPSEQSRKKKAILSIHHTRQDGMMISIDAYQCWVWMLNHNCHVMSM